MNKVIVSSLGITTLILTRPRIQCEKLSVYEQKEDPVYLVPEPSSPLQKNIKSLRHQVTYFTSQIDTHLTLAKDKVIQFESDAEKTIRDLVPRDEDLVPGLTYVGISTLFSSILTRNRAFPIRFAAPILVFVASGKAFTPKLSRNIGDWIYDHEPAQVRQQHDKARGEVVNGLWKAGELVEQIEGKIK